MGSLPRRFIFMVVAVFFTKFSTSESAQDLYHHEDVEKASLHDADTLLSACGSLLRTKAEPGNVRMCAWTKRLPMDKTGCPAYQFTMGYVPGHIRGCLLGPNVAVCSCRNREDCFKDVDDRPIRGTNYSLSAVQYELQCIRDEWLHPRIKREGEDGGGSSENPPDDTHDVKKTTTTEPKTTITEPDTTITEPKTTTTSKETTTTATTTTTTPTTPTTTTITTTTTAATTTEEETTTTEEEEEEEKEETTTEGETTTTRMTTKKPIVRPPTTTDDQDYVYTDYVVKKTKGVTSTKKPTTTTGGDYYTDDGGDDYNGETTKGGKRTKRPKITEKGGEGAEEDKQTFLIRENRTAFVLTILGAFASTLLLLIIIVIKMWFKLERRERIRDIQKEARKTKKSMRARRR